MTPGIAMGVGAPLYLPTLGTPAWIDPRLFAQDEEEWLALDYRMPTEPLEVVAIVRSLQEVPPVLAPYVRVVGWIVTEEPEPPLPTVPVLWVANLPKVLPSEAITIVDANAGVAYIQPGAEVFALYQNQLLRVASHSRYHLESAHLPVQTWDGESLQIGAVISRWQEVPNAVATGADFIVVKARKAPPQIARAAHELGGKPLWWRFPTDWAHRLELMHHLSQMSLECNLTVLLESTHDWAPWWNHIQETHETLRSVHQPVGQFTLALWGHASHPPAFPDYLPLRWQVLALPRRLSARGAKRMLAWHEAVVRAGLRRANLLAEVDAERLAQALACAPHALAVPHASVQEAKTTVARLGISESREWLLKRLRNWDDSELRGQPARWVSERL